jgi:UDPglucose--hexose-1-phosphate uridylyltransferase
MSEFRKDPVTGAWRLVAENRTQRPNDYAPKTASPAPSPSCPFCEGHESSTPPEVAAIRAAGGVANGPGWTIRSVPNLYPTVTTTATHRPSETPGPFQRRPGSGIHEVIVFTPRHAPGLAHLPPTDARAAFRFFRERVRALESAPAIVASILFENRGPESGGTLPHPHAQLIATELVPPRIAAETRTPRPPPRGTSPACFLESIVHAEGEARERIVAEDGIFSTFCPFASEHPYEVWFVPRRHASSFAEATDEEVDALAERLPAVLRALESARPSLSYNWFVHGLPAASDEETSVHWHIELIPRLLRPDGFEMGGGIPVNPVSPEAAAAVLRTALAGLEGEGARKR